MIVAIHQPQFMPWLGYFDKMDQADCFVVLDSVQFKKNEWQNRNRIKTAKGAMWLTVPVSYTFPALILDVDVSSQSNWRRKHWQALLTNYARAPHWEALSGGLKNLYDREYARLADANRASMDWLCAQLQVETDIRVASAMSGLSQEPTQRLVDICRNVGADTYLAGSGGRGYMDPEPFARAGIQVVFQEYEHPRYDQLHGDFISHLSALDLVLNCGPGSAAILRSSRGG